MLRLDVDTEETVPTIIGRAQLVFSNVLARLHQVSFHLFWALDPGVEGLCNADEGDLLYVIGVLAGRLADLLVYAWFVFFRGELDEELACVDSEEAG